MDSSGRTRPGVRRQFQKSDFCSGSNIEAVEDAIEMRCQYLAGNQNIIKGHTLFHWWNTQEQNQHVTV
jgi:hypothetical protein